MAQAYWIGSPFYRSLVNGQGDTIDEGTAIYQAILHGTELDELGVSVVDGRVDTLAFVMALGY